jgi:hypothetical protein
MQATSRASRGWLRTTAFAIAGAYSLNLYLRMSELPHLLLAIGFFMVLPNTFLHPVNWRQPTGTSRQRDASPVLTLLSLLGIALITIGLVVQWL